MSRRTRERRRMEPSGDAAIIWLDDLGLRRRAYLPEAVLDALLSGDEAVTVERLRHKDEEVRDPARTEQVIEQLRAVRRAAREEASDE